MDDREFTRLVDVNVRGVQNVIRHFVPAMVAKRKGVIVNLSSGWGRSTSPEVAPYCATKWAIEGLTQALADELPAGMAAVPLNPGANILVVNVPANAASGRTFSRWRLSLGAREDAEIGRAHV